MIDRIKENGYLWSLFSSEEEYNSRMTDKYNRFPHYLSGHRNIFEPLISKHLKSKGIKYDYPDDHSFALCITHDIDVVYEKTPLNKGLKAIGSLRRGSISEGLRHAAEIPFKKKPWWNFHEMVALEEQYDAKSTFFCMAIEKGERDWNYQIIDLKQQLLELLDKGWGVGLHGGHNAFNDVTKLKTEKSALEKVIGQKVIGFRNHYLRFNVPLTWEILSESGFEYDSTFGYADCIGFRNGMCHPFKPYNRITKKEIEIVEIPLIIMDGTLFDSYMRLGPDVAWQIIKGIIDNVEECNGVITVLWHNTQMFGDSLVLYKKILNYCYNKKAWLTSGDEIYRWFAKQHYHSIRESI